ncbi:MAG: SUMF1/EgtB/PvdO family nonheme iron enzyme [Acidobacteria bacterium]|nr:SUMF1/EgtB/PvdO family nonheme iron enzyme [Acidobacteriota bacterium]
MALKPDHPVLNVTYADAQEFCKWLSAKTGTTVRLPTEAEWEYAALGGHDGWMYPWGTTDPKTMARFSGNDDSPVKTVTREAYPANSFGLFNLSGNVAEWVLDYYDTNYYKSASQKNPTGPTSGKERVLRGGSYKSGADDLRAAKRMKFDPVKTDEFIGFRIVVK